MTWRSILAVALLALLVGGIVGFNMFRDQLIADIFADSTPPPLPVTVHEVAPGSWQPAIAGFGTVAAKRGVVLIMEADGRVLDVAFAGNEQVAEGDVLVQIDNAMQRAELRGAQADARLARQVLDRRQALGATGTAAEASVEEAEATLEAAEAQIERAESALRRSMVIAPFDGIIGIPLIEEGAFVSAGTEVASLQRTDVMRVDFNVSERQVGQIARGQGVELLLEDAGITLSGEITAIEPRTDPQTRLVAVRARVENPDDQLRRGQFVRLRVLLPEQDDVIAIPQTAVTPSLFGDFVYAVRENADDPDRLEARQVFVETGGRMGDLVEIRDGLEPGDRVVTRGQNRLSNGAPVTLDDDAAAEAAEEDAEAAL